MGLLVCGYFWEGGFLRWKEKIGMSTHSDFLPPPEIKEDVTALLSFGVWTVGLRKCWIFGEPHLDAFVEAPVAVVSVGTDCH